MLDAAPCRACRISWELPSRVPAGCTIVMLGRSVCARNQKQSCHSRFNCSRRIKLDVFRAKAHLPRTDVYAQSRHCISNFRRSCTIHLHPELINHVSLLQRATDDDTTPAAISQHLHAQLAPQAPPSRGRVGMGTSQCRDGIDGKRHNRLQTSSSLVSLEQYRSSTHVRGAI